MTVETLNESALYALGGDGWNGTMEALAPAFGAELPPVQKLILIGYADFPRSIESVAEFTGIDPREAADHTSRLLAADLIAEHRIPEPPGPSLRRLREMVFERDGWRCKHCGSKDDLSLDHIYPKSLGGGDDLDNLQTLCRSCNSRKGARVG